MHSKRKFHRFIIFKLDIRHTDFPPVDLAEPDGLLAIGGDLRVERLLKAYWSGIFPWYAEGSCICWYSPEERCVLFPEKIKIQKSMRPALNSKTFRISRDEAFAEVIKNCAAVHRKEQAGTWITTEMQEAYLRLHEAGYAHSVEVWKDNVLAGGLYGVAIGRTFCGESMFSLEANASKLALIRLCLSGDFDLIDCQLPTAHLIRLGAEILSREQFLAFLQKNSA